EHDELVFVFRIRIGVAQPHGKLGRVTAAEAVGCRAARQRPDEGDLDLVLRPGRRCKRRCKQYSRERTGNGNSCPKHMKLPSWIRVSSGLLRSSCWGWSAGP